MSSELLRAGVIGVGSMGQNHARIYQELPGVELVGVADADAARSRSVAKDYETRAESTTDLLHEVDLVSIAVPTSAHYPVTRQAIEQDVHVLVEKPFVVDLDQGRQLIELAEDRDVVLQVGHIERFNPAIRTLRTVLTDLEFLAMTAQRLGPPVGRPIEVSPVLDLMIHDIDVMRSLVDGDVTSVSAAAVPNEPYVSATLTFEGGVVGTLLASRITQRKVRRLSVTCQDSYIDVDYIAQTVDIHRQSLPEYLETNGGVRYRHQSVVERPTTENGEPLRLELQSFADAVRSGTAPEVTGKDGLAAVALADQILDQVAGVDAPAIERLADQPVGD